MFRFAENRFASDIGTVGAKDFVSIDDVGVSDRAVL
jgi:hypothetical protein